MVDLRKVRLVASFELVEALRSKLAVAVLAIFGLGAALGSYGFSRAYQAAEEQARRILARGMNLPEEAVPMESIRERALSLLAGGIDDPDVATKVRGMAPLSLFYGYASMGLIALVALVVSSGAVASDVGSGASRYVLPRCDRLSWVVGKYLGHVLLLAVGLLLGAASATLVGAANDPNFDAEVPMWMLLTSFQTWLYGCAYLAIFFGVSQTQRSKMVAIVLSFLTLVAFTISHSILSSDLVRERFSAARYVSYLFPAEHKLALWSPSAQTYLLGVASLALIGTVALGLGYRAFRRRDA